MNPRQFEELPFIGYEAEKMKLEAAVRHRLPVLLIGRRFSGRTRLVKIALSEAEQSVEPVWINWPDTFRALLDELAADFVRVKDPLFQMKCPDVAVRGRWARMQTSARLRGLISTALERIPRTIVIENVSNCSVHAYRFLQRACSTKDVNLIVTATETDSIGELRRYFWDPRTTMSLRPLARPDARSLFQMATAAYTVNVADQEQFQDEVLRVCRGNPGCILEMCRLASLPEYRSGDRVKLHLIRIDLAGRLTA